MAPTSYAVDTEWGESLVGLRMAVPLSWWPGYTGTELSLGKIAKFDGTASPPFLLAVDDEPGDTYAMRYDAVLAYAQVEHPTFGSFRLPDAMPEEPSPDDTVVVRRRGRGRRRRGRKRRRVRAPASSRLPRASDDSSADEVDSDDDEDDDGEATDDDEDDEDEDDDEVVVGDALDADDDEVVVGRTDAKDWKKVTEANLRAGRRIDPIPYTPREGDGDLFDVKISEEDLKGLFDDHGDIRFHRVHEWALPKLGEESYWE
jgi:hypothetical protein